MLYLIPTPLAPKTADFVLAPQIKEILPTIEIFLVENIRTSRRFLREYIPNFDLETPEIHQLNQDTTPQELKKTLDKIEKGKIVGVMSEAGCPSIADPGHWLVRWAHSKNIQVLPLVGPSSIFLALMASGLNGQQFCFNGYLPIDAQERKNKIIELEKYSRKNNQTQIFIETPYRNNQLKESFLQHLSDNTWLCVACDITDENSFIKTFQKKNWKKIEVDLHKKPTIFLFLAE
ncbi:MAG: SAM-dependent methyltransferase [Bacteroidetes bacterium]|nr:MAG: SAM-dependent methyltransferase [Bacteroidota bacterium]